MENTDLGQKAQIPLNFVNRTLTKRIRMLKSTSTDEKIFSLSYYKINMGFIPKR